MTVLVSIYIEDMIGGNFVINEDARLRQEALDKLRRTFDYGLSQKYPNQKFLTLLSARITAIEVYNATLRSKEGGNKCLTALSRFLKVLSRKST